MDPAVAVWRRRTRSELLGLRQAMPGDARKHAVDVIAGRLDRLCVDMDLGMIGLYWPIKNEPGLLPWAEALARVRGVELCLPVVVAPRSPLEYWRWIPGEAMGSGIWGIPVPARRDPVVPDLMLAPLVGFDAANYRLGYGGGYFDRTLAAMPRRPAVVGVGYGFSALETIFPQPHDIPMDVIVSDRPDDAEGEAKV